MIHTLLLQSEYSVYVYSCVAARWLRINHLIIICINFATEYKESRLLSSQQDIYLVLSTSDLLNHQRILLMYATCDNIGVIFVYFVTERNSLILKWAWYPSSSAMPRQIDKLPYETNQCIIAFLLCIIMHQRNIVFNSIS